MFQQRLLHQFIPFQRSNAFLSDFASNQVILKNFHSAEMISPLPILQIISELDGVVSERWTNKDICNSDVRMGTLSKAAEIKGFRHAVFESTGSQKTFSNGMTNFVLARWLAQRRILFALN